MKQILLYIGLISLMIGCAKKVEPTVENVNTIFASQDFTLEFWDAGNIKTSLSFANDVIVYKSDKPTYRREITFEEVRKINNFIQQIVNHHSNNLLPEETTHYKIYNTAYTTTIIPEPAVGETFSELIRSLGF